VVVSIRNSTGPESQGVSDERKAALVGQILRGELTPGEACQSEGLSELELKRWVLAYTRAARRAVDDQVAAALAAHGLEVDERPATEFTGNLAEMGLAELIQTIQYGKKDAQIRIEHAGEQSQLWCVDGDVVDAVSAQLTGSAAVYRILTLEQGRVHADFSPVQRPRTIHASTQALLLEAAKRSDECQQIRSRLGDTLNVYVPSASAPPATEIEPDQAIVLGAFDGYRSIDEVVHDSEFPDLETLGMIARLLEQEWLVIKPFRVRKPLEKPEPALVLGVSSIMPLVTSLVSRLSALRDPPPRLWASAAAGVAVVAGAFVIGFYSAQVGDTTGDSAASVPAPACGANLVLLSGGLCLDRVEVTAGEYQACVRSGSCEPVQREFPPAASTTATGVALAPTAGAAEAGSAPGQVPAPDAPTSPNTMNAGLSVAGDTPAATPEPEPASPVTPAVPGAPPAVAGELAAPPPAAAAPATAALGPRVDPTAHCNAGLPGREGYAINCVTYQQARRYCEWRGGRLPTRFEWELAAADPAPSGAENLSGGLTEWTFEPTAGSTDATLERAVVLGGGLDTGTGTAGGLRRLYMNANAQGRSVGFRCVIRADATPRGVLASPRDPAH
jgi:hypothetical protein